MESTMIGSKITEARKKIHLSQAQLAQRVFVSPQAVGKWERGESIPNLISLKRLAEILGVPLSYFTDTFQAPEDETALTMTADTKGDNEQKIQDNSDLSGSAERHIPINFTAVNLQESDFSGVALYKGKFKAVPLQKANFAGADLTGSMFEVSDAREANFDGAQLTDCTFSITDLSGASFHRSILVRTILNMSGQGAKFIDISLNKVQFIKSDLRQTIFENCEFHGVDFKHCDLRGVCFDGQTFVGVKFDRSALDDASFKGATLKNVVFTLPFSVTNKSYLAMKTICFDGATMDKLTYAALKGLGVVDLSTVNTI